MPHTFQFNSDQSKVVILLSGNVTGKEIITINNELIKNTDCVSQIWNFLKAVKIEISLEEMHEIAIQDRSLPANSMLKKVAMVVTRELSKGLDELYELFSKKWVGRPHYFESQTFFNFNEANE